MTSLRSNLTISLTTILFVVFASLWGLLSFAITKVAQDQLLMHLEHDGDALATAVHFASDGRIEVTASAVEEVYRQAQSGHYFQVEGPDGLFLKSPSLAADRLPTLAVSLDSRVNQQVAGPAGQSVLMLTRHMRLQGHPVLVTVAEDLSEMNREVIEQSLIILLVILPMFIAAVLLQRYMIGRALAPLTKVQQALEQVGRREVDRIDTRAPDEIQPLVDEVNRLLVLVSRRLVQSRTAVGNLAHALKTPLAMLFHASDDQGLPTGTRRILQENSQAIRDRLERELVRARLAGGDSVGGVMNPHSELEVMTRVLQSVYRDKHLVITIDVPDRPLPFDREDMLELLGNLADNACKWARARVNIRIDALGPEQATRIRVSDDGPGCSAAEFERLLTRGVRLDETTHGHGLGLSICREIVDFYGGSITFENDAALGGLAVMISLPGKTAGAA